MGCIHILAWASGNGSTALKFAGSVVALMCLRVWRWTASFKLPRASPANDPRDSTSDSESNALTPNCERFSVSRLTCRTLRLDRVTLCSFPRDDSRTPDRGLSKDRFFPGAVDTNRDG